MHYLVEGWTSLYSQAWGSQRSTLVLFCIDDPLPYTIMQDGHRIGHGGVSMFTTNRTHLLSVSRVTMIPTTRSVFN